MLVYEYMARGSLEDHLLKGCVLTGLVKHHVTFVFPNSRSGTELFWHA